MWLVWRSLDSLQPFDDPDSWILFGFSPPGFLLGVLVLVPFVSNRRFLVIRAVALVVAAMIIEVLVVGLASEFEIIPAVLFGTILIAIVAGLVAPIKITPRFLVYVAGAGLISGLSFHLILYHVWNFFCLNSCPWWNDVAFVSGWIVWHMAICAAIYFGRRRPNSPT